MMSVHQPTVELTHRLNSSLRPRPLLLQLLLIPPLLLLLRTLQPLTLMTLQHAMLAAKMPLTEPTVPYNQLRLLLALLEVAFGLFRGAAEHRQHDVDGAGGGDGEGL